MRPAALLLALFAAASAAAAPAAQPSTLWGTAGELWDPETGPMDFSFAGECTEERTGSEWKSWQRCPPAAARRRRRCPSPRARSSPLYASGYHFGDEEPPEPPVTRTLKEFQAAGMNDTAALEAMVAWANAQPESAGAAGAELGR